MEGQYIFADLRVCPAYGRADNSFAQSDYKGLVIKGMSEDDLEEKVLFRSSSTPIFCDDKGLFSLFLQVNELYHANPGGLKDG